MVYVKKPYSRAIYISDGISF